MSPNQDIVYSKGRSKSVAPSRKLISSSGDDRDPEYVSLGTQNPTTAARVTWGTPKKVSLGVVMASQSDEERIVNITPSRYASGSEGSSGSKEASASELAHSTRSMEAAAFDSISQGATPLDVLSRHALSDEA